MDYTSTQKNLSPPPMYLAMSLPAYLSPNDYSPRTPISPQNGQQSFPYAHNYAQSTPGEYTHASQIPQDGYFGARSVQHQDFLTAPSYQSTANDRIEYSTSDSRAVTPSLTPPGLTPATTPDEVKSSWGKRFVGNMLMARGVRATWQSTESSLKLPASLSPWGDNNPITLPNVRVRDVILFAGTTFGADAIVSGLGETLNFAGELLQELICTATENAAEEVLEHIMPEEESVLQTTCVKSLRIKIGHKLMGVDAQLGFFQPRECPWLQRASAAKGWFCPYLYASGRTPSISRAQDFAVAQCFGPHLHADYKLAHRLLFEGAATMSFCEPRPSQTINCARMIIFFTGITPWRTHAWSQARNPGEARLVFHMVNGCPAIVVPVNAHAPILAWSPWTLKQLHDGTVQPAQQYEEVFRYLDSIIDLHSVELKLRQNYKNLMAKGLRMIVKGAMQIKTVDRKIWDMIDPDRAGIVMFRY